MIFDCHKYNSMLDIRMKIGVIWCLKVFGMVYGVGQNPSDHPGDRILSNSLDHSLNLQKSDDPAFYSNFLYIQR